MPTKLVAVVAALSAFTLAVQAEGESNGDPFPFRASASTIVAGGVNGVPMTGSESPVQTANSLPRGFVDGAAAYAQAQSERRWFADQGSHAMVSAQRIGRSHK